MIALTVEQAPADEFATRAAEYYPSQFVTFRSAGGQYGAGIMQVQEIRSWQPTAPLPNRPHAARGVLDIRGRVVEVYDLSVLLGEAPLVPDKGSVILVICLATRIVGLLVESVSDIIQVEAGSSMSVPNGADPASARLAGMVNHESTLVGLLDLEALLSKH